MRRAFTLIELLIVIAIIAILALIAIPNFMEAQIRARVSRVQADMRSTATAIEAYYVDYNIYPLGRVCTNKVKENTPLLPATLEIDYYGFTLLTTPIAYLTFIPIDVFIEKGKAKGSKGMHPINYETFMRNIWQTQVTYGLTDGQSSWGPDVIDDGYKWSLSSYGPNRDKEDLRDSKIIQGLHDPKSVEYFNRGVYDPTNGTISPGRIMRTNRGSFPH